MPEKATAALQKLYKKVNGVALPYKAILNGDTDTVLATVNVTDTNIKLDSIVFKTQNGAKIDFKRNDRVFVLTLKGKLTYAEEQILATIKQGDKWKVIGAFMLVHISRKEVNVALVPTDATSQSKLDAVIAKTQEIYNKVGVKINFKKDNVLNIDSVVSGNTIQTDKNTLTSSYSSDQQKINALYQGTDNSYVLFITNKASSTGQKGYMRLNGQFGYVFATPSGAGGTKTPAHELGHGIFKLEHPFETYKTTESSTDLLMDYSQGTVLNHQDWKQINDPAFKLYSFQGQSSGELVKGFALAPDWSFVSNGDETTVKASGDTDTKGFLRGITTKEGTYIWKLKDGKYNYLHETTNKIYENPEVSPNANSTIWLFFENQNSRGKYIRTKYSVVEAIIKSKNETNLSKFIEKNRAKDLYTKGKDENRTTYWGYVGCSNCDSDGVENGNGSGGLVVDKTAKIPADELKQLIAQVSTSNQVNGINAKIFITAKDDTKGIAEVEKAIADLEKSNTREIYIWAKNYVANANFDLELAYGKGLSSKEKLDFDNFEATIKKINNQKESWLACLKFEGTYTYFNPLTAMLDGLAGLIGKAAIPAKYYNPDEPDYNPLPAKIYAYASGKIISEANSTDKYRASRQEFALVCGAWNGLVGTVEAIPAGVSMLMKLQGSAIDVIINHDGARDKLIKTIKNINKEQIDQLLSTIGDEIEKGYKKYTSNPCLVSYASGQAVFVVASLFIGAGEANVAKTFVQTLEKLDVAGQLIGKVFKIGGKFVKPVLNATSKGITLTLEKGVQLFRQVEIKLPNNLYCGIPIPTIKIKSTAAEIEQQLANTVEDVNGNKLVEVVLENGDNVPAIVGTEEGLAKIGSEITTELAKYLNVTKFIKDLANQEIEKIVKSWDDDMLKLLEADLSSKSMSDDLKSLLSKTDNIEIWKNLKNNPEFAFELAEESPDWAKWGKGNFFKTVTKAGREFGELVEKEIKDINSQLYKKLKSEIKDLDERTIFSQVQFCLTGKAPCNGKGEFFIPDFVAVIEKTNAKGQKYIDVIVLDAKLSKSTNWSPNQTIAKNKDGWVVKSVSDKNTIKGGKIQGFEYDAAVVKNGNFKKIYKEGTDLNVD